MSSRSSKAVTVAMPRVIRCAIYTRKSSEEGLALEFNSLDAQRDSAEAFIASQRNEGWTALPDRYDDGGFSGGNIERPGLAKLMKDIEAKKVDCVVVYKVDRLSRSLMDFSRLMQLFDQHQISFVSVTQQFNTTHSMGRLTLNILLSFAQFEREIIGERIRDKISAQRRRGKWTGGVSILGYDVDRSGPSPKLRVNSLEAARVREIFSLYLQHGSLLPVVKELAARGWQSKARVTKAGKAKGGIRFDKCSLHSLLTNPLYVGKIRHKSELFAGEHEGIVEMKVFEQVQTTLQHNGRSGGVQVRNRHGALLKGLLYCRGCGGAMSHTFTSKRGRQYRYYTCVRAIKSGREACPSSSLPAAEIERVVVDQIRCVSEDAKLKAEVLQRASAQTAAELAQLKQERAGISREVNRHHAELTKLAVHSPTAGTGAASRLADLHERIAEAEKRLVEIDLRVAELQRERIEEEDLQAAFADFQNVWGQLSPAEQAKLLALLVTKVEYDASAATVSVSFHASGIRGLSQDSMGEAA